MASEAADAAQKQPPTFGARGQGHLALLLAGSWGQCLFRPHGGSSAVAAALRSPLNLQWRLTERRRQRGRR